MADKKEWYYYSILTIILGWFLVLISTEVAIIISRIN